MKKFYDKIILIIAILVLGIGLLVFFTASGGPKAVGSVSLGSAPYERIGVPMDAKATANWPEPVPNEAAPRELFDLFTPPKIYIDPTTGEFTFDPGFDISVFPVSLAGIIQKPYRIQLEGYIEDDLTDASKSLLLLFDEELQSSVRARVGIEKPKHDFKVLDFSIVRVRDADDNVRKITTATILDNRTNEEMTLTHGEVLLQEAFTILIEIVETGEQIELSEVGQSFDAGEDRLILREINLEESTVTVEKQGVPSSGIEPQTVTLKKSKPQQLDAADMPRSLPSSASEDAQTLFDLFE